MCLHKIEYEGNEYKVKYIHDREVEEVKLSHGITTQRILPKGGTTIAFIGESERPIESGYAYCSDKDPYDKKLGRTIATGRLLKELGLNTKLALE